MGRRGLGGAGADNVGPLPVDNGVARLSEEVPEGFVAGEAVLGDEVFADVAGDRRFALPDCGSPAAWFPAEAPEREAHCLHRWDSCDPASGPGALHGLAPAG